MAEEQEKAAGSGVVGWWEKSGKWTKAGVIIGAGALVVAIAMYYQNQNQGNSGSATSGGYLTSPTGAYAQYPGEGEFFPSLPTATGTGSATAPTPAATIRNAATSGAFAGWDASHPNGVNVFNNPYAGNKIMGSQGFGSPVQLTSTSPQVINGNQWFQTSSGGWILGQDITQGA